MKRFINKTYSYYLFAILLAAGFSSCSKEDAYKKFEKGGEIVYPAVLDSIKVLPGKNRVIVYGLLTADPKVTKYRVFWNGRQDSIETAIQRSSGTDTIKQLITGLPEGPISFEIRTYDASGDISVPMFITGTVYGDRYQGTLNSRGILSSQLGSNGVASITWANVESSSGLYGMEIKYTDTKNTNHDTVINAAYQNQVSSLPNFPAGNGFTYSTIYKPDSASIDKFYTPFQAASVTADVTSLYLTNTSQPFSRSAYDGGRWGNLTGWSFNSAAANHSGYSCYASDESGVLIFQAGYGDPAIVNGKLYQTVTLPKGNYTLETQLSYYGFSDPAYLVAAQGSDLPDIDGLATALASTDVHNGKIQFSLQQSTQVTLGFVVNFVNSEYFKIVNVKLSSN